MSPPTRSLLAKSGGGGCAVVKFKYISRVSIRLAAGKLRENKSWSMWGEIYILPLISRWQILERVITRVKLLMVGWLVGVKGLG